MYIVMEIQAGATVSTLVDSYANRNDAESKFHQILTAAALSSVPKHSAVLMSDTGETLKMDSYIHNEVNN